MALELTEELRSACEAGIYFDPQIAGQALDELIELIIETSTNIFIVIQHKQIREYPTQIMVQIEYFDIF